jgi:hypothetical protein
MRSEAATGQGDKFIIHVGFDRKGRGGGGRGSSPQGGCRSWKFVCEASQSGARYETGYRYVAAGETSRRGIPGRALFPQPEPRFR